MATCDPQPPAQPVGNKSGRIVHCVAFPALEEELMGLGDGDLGHSPDRADALVWALTELMLAETSFFYVGR